VFKNVFHEDSKGFPHFKIIIYISFKLINLNISFGIEKRLYIASNKVCSLFFIFSKLSEEDSKQLAF